MPDSITTRELEFALPQRLAKMLAFALMSMPGSATTEHLFCPRQSTRRPSCIVVPQSPPLVLFHLAVSACSTLGRHPASGDSSRCEQSRTPLSHWCLLVELRLLGRPYRRRKRRRDWVAARRRVRDCADVKPWQSLNHRDSGLLGQQQLCHRWPMPVLCTIMMCHVPCAVCHVPYACQAAGGTICRAVPWAVCITAVP